MKVIAMYLPQYHQIPENDRWWGAGFTEWTAVRGAKQLYEEHNQPRVPLQKKYYNLLDHGVMAWQAELMKKYQVDGLCMYHYWFRDGKRILEKPAENLLRWKDIAMPFCFCWANETWARSWSNLQDKNVWADTYENEEESCGNGILLEQKYGREEQWKAHFEYLLPFFMDERYIRIEGRPLFLIYKSSEIFCLMEMLDCWNRLARLHGLPDIYVIGAENRVPGRDYLDASLNYQPAGSLGKLPAAWRHTNNGVSIWEYDDVWNGILAEKVSDQTFLEGVVGYDDTPRRGMSGTVVAHVTPDRFAYYLTELLAKSAAYGKDMVFLNAWNEWGEGMYLEPDEAHGYGYLNAIPLARKYYVDRIDKYKYIKKVNEETDAKTGEGAEKEVEKDRYYLHTLDHWMTLREKGFSVADWLKKERCEKIAIYGYGILGRHLCNELHENKIKIEYLIDRQKGFAHAEYRVYTPSDLLPEIDAVIVTAIFDYDEIYKNLRGRGIRKIISLESILFENSFGV